MSAAVRTNAPARTAAASLSPRWRMRAVWYHGAVARRSRAAGPGRMDRLLELTYRAERTHFWFRGFRRFVAPWLADAAGGPHRSAAARLRLRHRRQPGDAGAPRPRLRLRSDRPRAASSPRATASTASLRASIGAIPFPDASFDIVTSFDVLYGLPDEIEQAAGREMARVLKPGGKLLVTSAAFDLLRGGHGTFTNEVRRYTTSSLAGVLHQRRSRRGARVVHARDAVSDPRRRCAAGSAGAAAAKPRRARPISRCRRPPINAALSTALAVEGLVLPRVNLPFGSTVMGLAQKPR